MGVRRWRIVQQPTNFKYATGTFEIVYLTKHNFLPAFFSGFPQQRKPFLERNHNEQ
jgi:hypothetical protein